MMTMIFQKRKKTSERLCSIHVVEGVWVLIFKQNDWGKKEKNVLKIKTDSAKKVKNQRNVLCHTLRKKIFKRCTLKKIIIENVQFVIR